jgi:peptidoglycan/LPS O-acetylase OafA/YrhL
VPLDYPIISVTLGALAAYFIATLVGSIFVRVGFPIPGEERRIGCLDGLRGYLALSVLIHHFIVWLQVTRLGGTWSPPEIYLFNNLGQGGVTLFFMTTGLVFYPRILAGFHKTFWPAIYISRFFRIVPLIVFSVAVITLLILLRIGFHADASYFSAAAEWISSWKEVDLLGYPDSGRLNAYVLWSLRYEWIFYLVLLPTCAFGMDVLKGRWPNWTLPIALLFATLSLRFLPGLYEHTKYFPLFALGMLAYQCQQNKTIRHCLSSKTMTLPALGCLLLGLVSAPTPYGLLQLPLYAFFFTAVACGNDLFGILRTTGSLLLGECSYSIYILHGILLDILFVEGTPLTRQFTTSLLPVLLPLVAVTIACLTPMTYLCIERPAIRLGSTIAKRLSRHHSLAKKQLKTAP